MKWQGRQQSSNVEDRRRGGGGGKKVGAGMGIGTIIIIIIAVLLGENPMQLVQQMGVQGQQEQQAAPSGPVNEEEELLAAFVKTVLKDTEDVWNKIFPSVIGQRYSEPTLVLFTGSVRSACGNASAATGPFYCPGDQKLYIDLSFYQDLKNKFGAPGDFAMAYVVAHEVAHHVQFLLGYTSKVSSQRGRIPKKDYNALSVRLELQADFLAGVWAHHGQKDKNFLEEGDIEEAMNAAHAIGDDRLQKQARGYVVPDSFTHGTSAQRMRWFEKGLTTGDIRQGDTFSVKNL